MGLKSRIVEGKKHTTAEHCCEKGGLSKALPERSFDGGSVGGDSCYEVQGCGFPWGRWPGRDTTEP